MVVLFDYCECVCVGFAVFHEISKRCRIAGRNRMYTVMESSFPKIRSVPVLVKRALAMASCQVTAKINSRLLRYERRPNHLLSSGPYQEKLLGKPTWLRPTMYRREEVSFLKPATLHTHLPSLKKVRSQKMIVCKTDSDEMVLESPPTPRPWSPDCY